MHKSVMGRGEGYKPAHGGRPEAFPNSKLLTLKSSLELEEWKQEFLKMSLTREYAKHLLNMLVRV
jgi:hypothetical protein